MNSIVDTLIDRRLNVTIRLADPYDLSDFPPNIIISIQSSGKEGIYARCIVTDSKPSELALFVKFVDSFERDLIRNRPIGSVEVPYL